MLLNSQKDMEWKIEGNLLVREFQLEDFKAAVEFINKILPLAESIDHHPDILLHSYRKVKVMLFTHSANKVTDKDYNLAEAIDKLI